MKSGQQTACVASWSPLSEAAGASLVLLTRGVSARDQGGRALWSYQSFRYFMIEITSSSLGGIRVQKWCCCYKAAWPPLTERCGPFMIGSLRTPCRRRKRKEGQNVYCDIRGACAHIH